MKKLLFVNLLIFGILGNIWATTYYISPTGNDATGNGSATAPWKTLAKATAAVTTKGDIISVLPGTYTETQRSYLKVGVSIKGAGASTTIIKSTITGHYADELINLQAPDGTIGNQEISGITFDGNYVSATNYKTGLAIWITGVSNVSIHDCVIKNFFWRGVIFNGINADNPGTDVGFTKATGNKFYNNTVKNCADYGPASGGGSGALNLGFQNGMLIYNNLIQQNERPEGKNGWPIKYWNQGWIENCKIYNNTLIKKPYGGNNPGESGWDFAIEFFNVMALEIYGNNIQNGAIDLNYNYKGPYAYSTWIHHNTIHNPVLNTKGEGAIILEFRTEAALIENNVINNKTYGISFNTRGPGNKGGDRNNFVGGNVPGGYSYLVDNIIRNNLFTNMYQGQGTVNRFAIGVISEGTDDPQISNMQIYNNTAVAKAGNTSNIGFDFTSQPNGSVAGVTIKDNIIVGFAYESIKGVKAKTQGAVNITNNCYWNNYAPVWPSATISGNFSSNPNFDANWNTSLPIGYKPGGTTTPPPACTSWTFGPWSTCQSGFKMRSVTASFPAGCVGNAPVDSLMQACTVVPPPPVNDTIRCIVILHGSNLARRLTTYIVKRANGLYYDDRGREVKVWAYKTAAADWFRKELSDGLFYLWF
jgi:hypothetical protein